VVVSIEIVKTKTGVRVMSPFRRRTRAFAVAALLATSPWASSADAQEWPTRNIRAVVPLSAGSAVDIVPRIVFEQV
jgi:tripartite-type tricarboxylate transporter receptor subunit TctC